MSEARAGRRVMADPVPVDRHDLGPSGRTLAAPPGDAGRPMPDPVVPAPRVAWRGDVAQEGVRLVPRETPIALTYNRATHAVMLGTPADLEDFAAGFSLSEGIIEKADDILALEVVEVPDGIECRMDLAEERLAALTRRQRRLAGPSGCGLCGLDSLAAAIRPAPAVPAGRVFTPAMVQDAMRSMPAAQTLNAATRAVHAAAFWTPNLGWWRCGKTSAGITRWTSWRVRWRAPAWRRRRGWCCCPAESRSKWCRRRRPWARR